MTFQAENSISRKFVRINYPIRDIFIPIFVISNNHLIKESTFTDETS